MADRCSIQLATEEDLDALVKVQLAAFGGFGPERLIVGRDTSPNRAIMASRHAQHMAANPGLKIAKAQLPDGNIIGFCMFYFPDPNAASGEERVPTPLRPLSSDPAWAKLSIEAPWIDDGERRAKAEAILRFIHQEIQKHVLGRECVYVRYMCVDPALQRQGVGKALMAWASTQFDEFNVDAYLEASAAGEGLYKQFGFEPIGLSKGEFDDGLNVEYSHMWRKANA